MDAKEILREAPKVLADLIETDARWAYLAPLVTFHVSSRMTRAGAVVRYSASPATGEVHWAHVTVSVPFFANPDNRQYFRNTILHELAHVAAPFDQTHGKEWQAMHRAMGGTGERFHRMQLAQGYKRRERKPRVQVACGCGCGAPMTLGPTQYKRAASGARYYLKGHRPGYITKESLRAAFANLPPAR